MSCILSENVTMQDGSLHFAGMSVDSLADRYSTPLYLMDEDRIRKNCREYKAALDEVFGCGSMALYASKAASFKAIYGIIAEEGLGADVVSPGEIHTAVLAGFPMEKAYFQGNNKTDWDIEYAMDCGVGYFVCDNKEEVEAIDLIARKRGIRQKILLRLTPGIDPHTYAAVATGKVDSKFGTAIETGQAESILAYTLGLDGIELMGFHCHVGSMVFDSDVFMRSAEIMLGFMADMKKKYGYTAKELDLGGGYGVRYVEAQPKISISENIRLLGDYIKDCCGRLGIELPKILLEPGRSIVADAGMTVYTVGTVKRITGYKNYVSIDGGMTDNPRYALYGSSYTVLPVGESEAPGFKCDLVGRCCESGDIIQTDITLPKDISRGDRVAVLTTGAYNYSMASNYNRLPRPAMVMLKNGSDRLVIRRETLDDLAANDL